MFVEYIFITQPFNYAIVLTAKIIASLTANIHIKSVIKLSLRDSFRKQRILILPFFHVTPFSLTP